MTGNSREKHYLWQTLPSYETAHARIIRYRGQADVCAFGCEALRYEWANLTGDYANLDDYAPMCTKCHQRFDYTRATMEEGFLGHHTSDPRTKLTQSIVKECRLRRAMGEKNRDLAREFGVSEAAMSVAISGKKWRMI